VIRPRSRRRSRASAGGGFADGTGRPPHKPLAWHWLIVVLLDHRPQLSHDDLGGLLDAVDLCLLIVVGFVETANRRANAIGATSSQP